MFKNFKNKISYLLVGLLVGCLFPIQSLFAEQPITLIINGKTITNASPQIVSDRTYVPLRVISEELGATVEWDGVNRVVSITSRQQGSVATPPVNNVNNTNNTPADNAVKLPVDNIQQNINNNIFIKTGDLVTLYDDRMTNENHRLKIDVRNYKIRLTVNNKSILINDNERYYDAYNDLTYYSYNRLLELYTQEQLNSLPHYTF